MNPEAGSFYYDTNNNVLAYCASCEVYFDTVALDKVNAIDADEQNVSCSLEYFRNNFKKVAFLINEKEVQP